MSQALPPALDGLAPLRVAAVQAEAVAGHVAANVATAAAAVDAAVGRGAQLVVLPELFLSGYDPETLRLRPDDCDVDIDDGRLEPLQGAARDHSVAVLCGASVRMSHGARALALLSFLATGEVLLAYTKQHLWHAEQTIFTPGTDGASVELQGWPIGLGVCYDGCFPEHARAASDAGALAYVCPSAYVVGSEHRRDLYYSARALDNGIYVVMAGLTGRCGSLEFSGGTAIYDPQGRPVARVESGTGMAVADLDVSLVHEARLINPYTDDRLASLGGREIMVLDAAR
ncbi:MAG: carbon-nitrogen hydrolase family protein [Nocardioidaceae bacterium]|nr:carbon-nitrogen hydrolase family protein [Nocardioidaceae bacterium]